MSGSAMLILTTCGSAAAADALAAVLVESGQAACVSRLDNVRSTYRWQGAVETTEEVLVLIKTTEERLDAVRDTVHAQTSYELPEFLAVRVDGGSRDYLSWLAETVAE
jgi:periplasmic divalent cation tolerance protein